MDVSLPPPLAVFRCDASPAIGTGHVVRCRTLADVLAGRGWRCVFITNREAATVVPALADGRHGLTTLSPGEDGEPDALRRSVPDGVDVLVVDHYGLAAGYERPLRPWARRILAIDDLADRDHDCDLLLDQGVGRRPEDYHGRVPSGCQVLAGAGHALLRPEFAELRPRALDRRRSAGPVGTLLVSLGGTDPDDVTSRVLAAAATLSPLPSVQVVMGAGAPHLDRVRAAAAGLSPPAEVLVGVADMAARMAEADLAVGAGGGTALERCCLGLPTVALVIADNQRQQARELAAAGAARLVAVDHVRSALAELMADHEKRRAMAGRAAALCDGQGAVRVADAVEAFCLRLRPATMADADDLLAWRNDPVTRAQSRQTGEVVRQDHLRWLARMLTDPECLLLIGTEAGAPAGTVRFNRRAAGWEVSIAMAAAGRGRGGGTRLLAAGLAAFRALHPGETVVAAVRLGNTASERLFARLGFGHDDVEEGFARLSLPPAHGS